VSYTPQASGRVRGDIVNFPSNGIDLAFFGPLQAYGKATEDEFKLTINTT
jgi:hypothetical protein